MTLRRQVINLVGLNLGDERGSRDGIRQITVMQKQSCVAPMWIFIDRLEPLGVERRRPSNQPVNFIAFAEQKLSQIRAVLASNAGDEGFFH